MKNDFQAKSDLAQALGWVEPQYRGVVPPIYMSSVYERDEFDNYPGGHSYTRDQNPSYDQGEALLARLEGGEDAMFFSSGMAAATSVFEVLDHGAHVIAPRKMYFALKMWMRRLEEQGRIQLTEVDHDDFKGFQNLLLTADLFWLETPANPGGELIDMAKWVRAAKERNVLVVADNTLSTPILSQPIKYGVDIVMHSASKQLNGHGDVVAGALVTAKKNGMWEKLKFERGYRGAILGPMEAWLLLRGMRTLDLRVRESAESALFIAESLENHSRLSAVYYPGLKKHPGHEIAASQMKAFGYVISICLKGGPEARVRFFQRLRLFKNASSLGGVESLVEHRSRTEGDHSELENGLLRLSIGIEDRNDLLNDLIQALD